MINIDIENLNQLIDEWNQDYPLDPDNPNPLKKLKNDCTLWLFDQEEFHMIYHPFLRRYHKLQEADKVKYQNLHKLYGKIAAFCINPQIQRSRVSVSELIDELNDLVQQPPQQEEAAVLEDNTEVLEELYKRFREQYERGDQDLLLQKHDVYYKHALLSLMLYNIPRDCSISFETTNCINDGTVSECFSIESLQRWVSTNAAVSHPISKQPFHVETFYFANCLKEDNFFNAGNLARSNLTFSRNNCNLYKAAFVKAKKDFDKIIENEEPKNQGILLLHFLNIQHIVCKVNNSDSLKEIHQVLISLLKNITDDPEYKNQYASAQTQESREAFKNFVIKCLLAIAHFAKFWVTTESIEERYQYFKEEHYDKTIPKDYKDYIITTLKQPNNIVP